MGYGRHLLPIFFVCKEFQTLSGITVILSSISITTDVERVAIASVLSLQATGINRSELDAPEADRFADNGDGPFSQEIFNVWVAEIESEVEPDGIGNNVRWESVSLGCIHRLIIPISGH